MSNVYYGKVTRAVYEAALDTLDEDGCCWEERVPLAEPALIMGPSFPEDWLADEIISYWEAAHAVAKEDYGENCYELESVSLFLDEASNPHDCEFAWMSDARPRSKNEKP